MGYMQKKEMEVLRQMKKKELHDLRRHICPSYKLHEKRNIPCTEERSNRSLCLSQDKYPQSIATPEGLRTSKGGSLNVSQAMNSQQLMKLSYSDRKLDQKVLNPCGDDNHASAASLDDNSISEASGRTSLKKNEDIESVHLGVVNASAGKSKSSNSTGNPSCKLMSMSGDMLTQLGDGCLSYKNEKHFLIENLGERELCLSNLTINGPISLANISGRTSLFNLINYLPEKSPVICSRKKLLILDINGILADIVYPPPKGYKADTKIAGRAVFFRPFCSDFLNFCVERFNVAIWSSRSRKIMDRMINHLMGDLKHKLVFCWDLSRCTDTKFRTLENKHKALVFKELRKLWDSCDPHLQWEKGDFNESNTLLLDDTPYKALLNPPHTGIFPYSFEFKDRADNAIGPGGNIRAYLEELAAADNVQKYIEQHPFGQSAITERSLSWHFYNKVIQVQSAVVARS